jgi:type IV secretion system protein VirD4
VSRQGSAQVARPPGGGDDLFAIGIIAVGAASLAVWAGAQLAAILGTGSWVSATPAAGLGAMIRLPAHGSRPADAWPPETRASLPGPILYWTATVVTLVVLIGVAVWVWARFASTRIGTRERRRLGVTVGARLATPRDLVALVVAGPTPGRFIFGMLGRRLLATETRRRVIATTRRRRPRTTRAGGRTAMAVIGPSQSGKTATVVAGILDWDGPAILSSVKNDLFADTVARRLRLGDVYLFDPMRTVPDPPPGVIRVGWSPLPSARTVPGAIEVASALLDAAPTDGVTNASYWTSKGQALLWPILFAAAHSDSSMADVVRWLASQDGNPDPRSRTKPPSAVRDILVTQSHHHDERVGIQAAHALSQFDGFFGLDHRTRSDIYSTSQTLVQPWEDPNVSFASTAAAGPTADLRLVLSGANTLYVCMPLKDASRYAVVFGGLLGSLLRDQAYDVANRYGQPLPNLLCVLDEAGNTPLRWLPEVASTCSGVGVQLVTVWQSKAQIDAIYQAQAGPMLTNHATKVIFAGVSDVETLQYVTYLAGDEEVTQTSANADAHLGGYRRGVGDSTIHRPLLPAEVLRQAEPGHALLIHGILPPAHIQGRHAGSDRRLAALSAGTAPKPQLVAVREALIRALAFDPTPPIEVLRHLGGPTAGR